MNAYEQKKAQLALIQQIRDVLPPGYSASAWGQEIRVQYRPVARPQDARCWYVSDEHSWVILKAKLGLL